MEHAVPVQVGGGVVVLQVSDSEVHLEGLERGRRGIEEAIREVLGLDAVRVQYRAEGKAGNAKVELPRRLDRDAEQQERLRLQREQNPALDAIAEALDLEVIE
jgi:hypothetical protein